MSDIYEKLRQQYESFTKSEKKITDYILEHREAVQHLSISDLSDLCSVSISTISVFCRKLNLDSFNEFKLELAKAAVPASTGTVGSATGEILESDTIDEIFEKTCNVNQTALLQTYRLLERERVVSAVRLLEDADRVLCLGQGNHSIVAEAAWSKFTTVTNKFSYVTDSNLQILAASTLSERDVVLYFSYSGTIREFLNIAKVIKQRGAKIILVSRYKKSKGAALSDCVLICGSDEKPLLFGSTAAIVAQLFVVDVLFNVYCHDDFASSEKSWKFVADVLTQR